MNRFQKIVARVCRIVKFDIDQALRDAYRKGKEATERKYAERTTIWIDPTIRTRGYPQTAAYEPPEKHTGPAQFGMRHRATMRSFQEHPGMLMQHESAMRKKAQTVKLDPETVQLPRMTHNPLSITRLEPMHSAEWML